MELGALIFVTLCFFFIVFLSATVYSCCGLGQVSLEKEILNLKGTLKRLKVKTFILIFLKNNKVKWIHCLLLQMNKPVVSVTAVQLTRSNGIGHTLSLLVFILWLNLVQPHQTFSSADNTIHLVGFLSVRLRVAEHIELRLVCVF